MADGDANAAHRHHAFGHPQSAAHTIPYAAANQRQHTLADIDRAADAESARSDGIANPYSHPRHANLHHGDGG